MVGVRGKLFIGDSLLGLNLGQETSVLEGEYMSSCSRSLLIRELEASPAPWGPRTSDDTREGVLELKAKI